MHTHAHLALEHCDLASHELTVADVASTLSLLPELQHVTFGCQHVWGDAPAAEPGGLAAILASLRLLPRLRSLCLQNAALAPAGVAVLWNLQSLCGMTQLSALMLGRCDLRNADVASIVNRLSGLVELGLSGNDGLTDACLAGITAARLPQLSLLVLPTDRHRISAASVQRLSSALPRLLGKGTWGASWKGGVKLS